MNDLHRRLTKGMTTAEAVTSMVSESDIISAIFVFAYRHPPLLQKRVALSSSDKEVLGKALGLRESLSLPFWEALMLSLFDEPTPSSQLLRQAMFHQSHKQSLERISRDEVIAGRLVERVDSQHSADYLSLSSLVEVEKVGFRHFPLLDFHCPESEANDRLVAEACRLLFQSAAVVCASGKSYHAIGVDVVVEAEISTFLARSLLLAPIIDARYVAHQLLEGVCALRLSSSAEKPEPRLKFMVT